MVESRLDLQNSPDYVHDYYQRWKLCGNTFRTKIDVFRKGVRLSINDIWFYGDLIVEVVEHFSYLGINIFFITGEFSATQTFQTGVCEHYFKFRVLHMIIDRFQSRNTMYVIWYTCFICTTLLMWIMGTTHCCIGGESMPTSGFFCKWVSKVSKSTTNEMVYGELWEIRRKKGTHSEILVKNCT